MTPNLNGDWPVVRGTRHAGRRATDRCSGMGRSAGRGSTHHVAEHGGNLGERAGSSGSVAGAPAGSSDNGSPELRGLTVTPRRVDVRRGPQQVRVVVDAVDTGGPGRASGMSGGSVSLKDDEGSFKRGSLARTPAGGWATTFRIPRGGVEQLWVYVALWDEAGNGASWAYNDLADLGYPNRVVIVADHGRPLRIKSLYLAASRVDTRRRSKTIPVTARLAGRGYAPGEIKVWAKEYNEPHRVSAALRRVPDSPDTFRGGLQIPRWSTTGLWRVTRLRVVTWFESWYRAGVRRRGPASGRRCPPLQGDQRA